MEKLGPTGLRRGVRGTPRATGPCTWSRVKRITGAVGARRGGAGMPVLPRTGPRACPLCPRPRCSSGRRRARPAAGPAKKPPAGSGPRWRTRRRPSAGRAFPRTRRSGGHNPRPGPGRGGGIAGARPGSGPPPGRWRLRRRPGPGGACPGCRGGVARRRQTRFRKRRGRRSCGQSRRCRESR